MKITKKQLRRLIESQIAMFSDLCKECGEELFSHTEKEDKLCDACREKHEQEEFDRWQLENEPPYRW